jgi:hypothetical protein
MSSGRHDVARLIHSVGGRVVADTAEPCGVPRSRVSSVPSGRCGGAESHRRTYNTALGDRTIGIDHTMRGLDRVLGRVRPALARRRDGYPSSGTAVLLTRCPLPGGTSLAIPRHQGAMAPATSVRRARPHQRSRRRSGAVVSPGWPEKYCRRETVTAVALRPG